jgi:hypothetical protein
VSCNVMSHVLLMLNTPPSHEKRRRASVGAVVKITRFEKDNVGSILANMMVYFPLGSI